MPVQNVRSGALLAKTLVTVNSYFPRTIQHISANGIPGDSALWINPCNSIHTVGMHKPIDIAFLDKNGRVVKMLRSFPPNCVAESVDSAASALELPSNRLSESGTVRGDQLLLDPW